MSGENIGWIDGIDLLAVVNIKGDENKCVKPCRGRYGGIACVPEGVDRGRGKEVGRRSRRGWGGGYRGAEHTHGGAADGARKLQGEMK